MIEFIGQVPVCVLPFALSQSPAGDDPQGDHEYQEDCSRTDGHEGLKDETGVEIDPVQRTDTPRRRVREQLGMQQHHPEKSAQK